MKSASEIRRDAGVALQSSAGWLPSLGAWAAWFGIEKLVTVPMMLLASLFPPLFLAASYYVAFVKVYGISMQSMSVVRGEPRFRYAFAGFGHGWRTVGVHLWMSWRLFRSSVPLLLYIFGCGIAFGALKPDTCRHWLGMSGNAGWYGLGALALLLTIPIVRAWYRYRVSYYVFVDHVDWKLSAVVDESARLTGDRWGRMFRLDFVFLCICLLLMAPGVYQMAIGGMDFYHAGGDLLELQAALINGTGNLPPGIGTVLRGLQSLGLAQLVVTLLLQPYWSTVLAAYYETLLDEDEAAHGRSATEPPDGIVQEERT